MVTAVVSVAYGAACEAWLVEGVGLFNVPCEERQQVIGNMHALE